MPDKEAASRSDSDVLVIKVPPQIPVLPLTGSVIFPKNVAHLHISKTSRIKLIESLSEKKDSVIALLTPKDPNNIEPKANDLNRIGVLARIVNKLSYSKDIYRIIVQGLTRIHVKEFISESPFIKAKIEKVHSIESKDLKTTTLLDNIVELFTSYVTENQRLSNELIELIEENYNETPGDVSDLISSLLPFDIKSKQKLLETRNVYERLKFQYDQMNKLYQNLKIENEIVDRTSSNLESGQREFFLRKQLEEIKKELGDNAENPDLAELKEKFKKANLTKEISDLVDKNLEKLARMHGDTSEYPLMVSYLEYLIELPWNISTKDNLNIVKVKEILDKDHYGLKKAKERIVEFLAVMKLKKDLKGPILCFIGPPGTGKTSVAISIAKAIGRKYVRLSMGGVRDEAEIRGHRRTYVGAMPGRFIQGIKNAGSNNPLFIIDEIDKVSASDGQGDPSAALLEVLDPEQNANFRDNFLGCEFDLSKVLFIATANDVDSIPAPLLDRMELIEFESYTMLEKVKIAIKFLIPNQIKKHGLLRNQIQLPVETIKAIIKGYNREAGVRNLNRDIATVCRKVAKKITLHGKNTYKILPKDVKQYLGPRIFIEEEAPKIHEVGIATGLAWTPVGGEILVLEIVKVPGKGDIKITGQLGNVMQESVQAAITVVKANAKELGYKLSDFNKYDIHFNFPDLATPKDGPSAGITIATALASLMSERKTRADVAMTGEITLKGKILPIGGVKEKVMAAYRAGIKTVIIPLKNKADTEEIPREVKKKIQIIMADHVDRVFKETLLKKTKASLLQKEKMKDEE